MLGGGGGETAKISLFKDIGVITVHGEKVIWETPEGRALGQVCALEYYNGEFWEISEGGGK